MERNEFDLAVASYCTNYRSMRYGQAVSNVAWNLDPVAFTAACELATDPFYMDSKANRFIDAFLSRLNAKETT